MMKKFPIIDKRNFHGRNIKYGVREFAMAAAATGLYETQMIIAIYWERSLHSPII